MTDVIVVGSINMDLVFSVPHLPTPGETISGHELRLVPGGKGANQAVAVSRMGKSVAMIGKVGDDVYGQTLIEGLRNNGVQIDGVSNAKSTTSGLAFITLDDLGQNAIVIIAGANGQLGIRDVDALESMIAAAKVMVTQFEVPMPTVEHSLRLAKKHGLTTIVNPAPAQPIEISHKAIKLADILVLNETETEILTGICADDFEACIAAGQALLKRGPSVLIITLGASGAVLVEDHNNIHLPAPQVDVVDTTAAGDAFIGALTAALLDGHPMKKAVDFANRAGALAVTRHGAQPSLPTAADVNMMETTPDID